MLLSGGTSKIGGRPDCEPDWQQTEAAVAQRGFRHQNVSSGEHSTRGPVDARNRESSPARLLLPRALAIPKRGEIRPRYSQFVQGQFAMNIRHSLLRWIALVVAGVPLTAQTSKLGEIHFPTSGPPAAQKHFLTGMLYLHSFEYDDAREEFRLARKISPRFAMAYWGEAMTYNEPLWGLKDRNAAQNVLKALSGQAPTNRERKYLHAVQVLFGEGRKEDRDLAYAEEMGRLSAEFPDDAEAAALYALALLGTCHNGRDEHIYLRAAAILQKVVARHPRHSGALHYLIHCYDDPGHAKSGLAAARAYARIAPDAAHALHMPAHIFVALGMWEEAADSNERSWLGAQARAKRKKTSMENGAWHALWWLEYAYLQQGRYLDARKLVDRVQVEARSGSAMMRFHLAEMAAALRVETGEAYVIQGGLNTGDLGARAIANDLLAAGLVAFHRGWKGQTERVVEGMESLPPDPAFEIARLELTAMLKSAEGKTQEALTAMSKAAALEDEMPYESGPPVPVKPAHELYGDLLLQFDRAKDAMGQYRLALKRYPGRALSILGIARAAEQMGDRALAQETYRALEQQWRRADPEVRKAIVR
jgi:tetratricopeptide (TPR) repeat protein